MKAIRCRIYFAGLHTSCTQILHLIAEETHIPVHSFLSQPDYILQTIPNGAQLGFAAPRMVNPMKIVCKDVTAETLYDVLHDTSYRKKWDSNMIDTYDIGRLTVNADVGYYSCTLVLLRDHTSVNTVLYIGNNAKLPSIGFGVYTQLSTGSLSIDEVASPHSVTYDSATRLS
ncbi:UNVERIFIED_CONTAM: hypothetical protein FKN15_056023 [Acipenser sinensis]